MAPRGQHPLPCSRPSSPTVVMICSTWWAAAFASLCVGGCSADCTIVEGHECCSFAAGDSQAQECGRISPGVLTGDGKHACGQHCMEDDLCFWTYSAGGDYAGDCELLGRCGTAPSNRPGRGTVSAVGRMHSVGCFSWGDAEPVRPQPRPFCCSHRLPAATAS